jgi:hypothetical protein
MGIDFQELSIQALVGQQLSMSLRRMISRFSTVVQFSKNSNPVEATDATRLPTSLT